MARDQTNAEFQSGARAGVEQLLERARHDEAVQSRKAAGFPDQQPPSKAGWDETPVLRINRKAERRRFSTFNVILILFGLATSSILYISNIIAINHLAIDVGLLKGTHAELLNSREVLKAEIDRKSGRERIVKIARDKLGLVFPAGQPDWIIVDDRRPSE